jgi:hypothetical protein
MNEIMRPSLASLPAVVARTYIWRYESWEGWLDGNEVAKPSEVARDRVSVNRLDRYPCSWSPSITHHPRMTRPKFSRNDILSLQPIMFLHDGNFRD